MATMTFFDGNGGVWRWDSLREYSIESVSPTQTVFVWDEGKGGVFDLRSPFRIIINTKDVVTAVDGEGNDSVIAGTVTSIVYRDDGGGLLARITGLNGNWARILNSYADGNDDFFRLLLNQVTIYEGAQNGLPATWNDGNDWDDIQTSWGNDTVRARGGNDYIKDAGGTDFYDGGGGQYDTISYNQWYWNPRGAVSGIRADLATNKIIGPDGNTDTVYGIEQIHGTFLNDIMKGDFRNNGFQGYAGADSFDGRGGWDWVYYDNEQDQGGRFGIVANLALGFVWDGFHNRDTIANIEEIGGTNYADTFRDNAQNNWFQGFDGNDRFVLSGGNDGARGGGGADTFVFLGLAFGNDNIDDFEVGIDRIRIVAATNMADLDITSDANGTNVNFNTSNIWLPGVGDGELTVDSFIFVLA